MLEAKPPDAVDETGDVVGGAGFGGRVVRDDAVDEVKDAVGEVDAAAAGVAGDAGGETGEDEAWGPADGLVEGQGAVRDGGDVGTRRSIRRF